MKIECNFYSGETNGFGFNQKAIWSRFISNTSNVIAYSQPLSGSEYTEIWLIGGHKCVIDIPFNKFDKEQGRYIINPQLHGNIAQYPNI